MPATTDISGHTLFTRNTWRVSIGGETVGIYTECDGLRVEIETLDYAEGGNNDMTHHLPGRLVHKPLTLSRGLTDEKALLDWFNKRGERKEVTVTLEQAGGSITRAWTFSDAFPISWEGPSLSASATDVAGETLVIAHSGMRQV
jgi:phage tail-like protein